jgi:hypothetical protein
MPKTLTDEQYRLAVTVAAQVDYAWFSGERLCMEAAAGHAAMLLRELGEKTAAEERAEEEEDDEDDA